MIGYDLIKFIWVGIIIKKTVYDNLLSLIYLVANLELPQIFNYSGLIW